MLSLILLNLFEMRSTEQTNVNIHLFQVFVVSIMAFLPFYFIVDTSLKFSLVRLIKQLVIATLIESAQIFVLFRLFMDKRTQSIWKQCVTIGLLAAFGFVFVKHSSYTIGLGLYLISIAIFHLSEYCSIAMFSTSSLSSKSFLLDL
ncbi:hypothetical protein ACOME3_006117 [Neoechinorhynchus agilis]